MYKKALILTKQGLPSEIEKHLKSLNIRLAANKGVYTVLITLGVYKLLNPKQDIRQHKIELENGFSGRSFDTACITPTLKRLGLLSMAESGWLTRSLEQAYAYDNNYNGKITPKELKDSFLFLVNEIQFNNEHLETILIRILEYAIEYRKKNTVEINSIDSSEKMTISNIINLLEAHFFSKYSNAGGSKLPVLAFYAIYKQLIPELKRYKDCNLEELGSHTASDRTSKSSGDIEIKSNNKIFESIEIKHDRMIDSNILRIAQEKIYRFNPIRYYILSNIGIKSEDKEIIQQLVEETKKIHGCQIIVNGMIPTLKYYLRLVDSLDTFVNNYIELVISDKELKIEHKEKLKILLEECF